MDEDDTLQMLSRCMGNDGDAQKRMKNIKTLVDYARGTISRLVLRQIASETQEMIIKDILSRRKDPLPQGSGTLDNIEGLANKGVKLTKAEKDKLDKLLRTLGISDRQFALFRVFREAARETAHPDLDLLPHDAVSKTALDNMRTNPELEKYAKEVLDTYWRTVRYYSDVALGKGPKKKAEEMAATKVRLPTQSGDKIDRSKIREKLLELPLPAFSDVVESVSELTAVAPIKQKNKTYRTVKTLRHKNKFVQSKFLQPKNKQSKKHKR